MCRRKVKKFIVRHNEIGTVIPINVDGRPAWQRTMDDWQGFLKTLEALVDAEKNSIANLAKNGAAIETEQLTNLPASCQILPQLAKTLPEAADSLPKRCQIRPQPATDEAAETPSIQSIKSFASISDPDPTPSPSTVPEPDEDELEFEDCTDGFTSDRDRLAAARAELQAHLNNQPLRFAKLTREQQSAIFNLLETGYSTRVVAKLLAEPPPLGAGIHVSKTAVCDWRFF